VVEVGSHMIRAVFMVSNPPITMHAFSMFWVWKPLEGETQEMLLGRLLKSKVGVVVVNTEGDTKGSELG